MRINRDAWETVIFKYTIVVMTSHSGQQITMTRTLIHQLCFYRDHFLVGFDMLSNLELCARLRTVLSPCNTGFSLLARSTAGFGDGVCLRLRTEHHGREVLYRKMYQARPGFVLDSSQWMALISTVRLETRRNYRDCLRLEVTFR